MSNLIEENILPIYSELLLEVENGAKFKIDLEKRTMKVGNKFLIKKGDYDLNKPLVHPVVRLRFDTLPKVLKHIEDLYKQLKTSAPSERSESKRRTYFKALSADELMDGQLAYNTPREYAQAALEGFILCMILEDILVWNEELMGKWFYQGDDKDLILLRTWIEGR